MVIVNLEPLLVHQNGLDIRHQLELILCDRLHGLVRTHDLGEPVGIECSETVH